MIQMEIRGFFQFGIRQFRVRIRREGLLYGTEYTGEQINEALRTADPFALVPTRDEDGHGTFTAGIAAGSETADGSFIGAAPEAYLAVVKLKTAKQRLRDYYFLPEDTAVYQETDIMMSVRFLLNLQRKRRLPMVLCLGLGTNTGGHDGYAPVRGGTDPDDELSEQYSGSSHRK